MSFPSWVVSADDKKLYGKCLSRAAPPVILADKDVCIGFADGGEISRYPFYVIGISILIYSLFKFLNA